MIRFATTLVAFATLAFPAAAYEQRACIARAIYWEARGLSENGQRAVAEVIWNRVNHPAFPKTPCAVVFQRSGGVCQFSWACSSVRNVMPPRNASWQAAWHIAGEAPGDITNGALYFRTKRYRSRWRHLVEVAEVDEHVFFTHKQ
jgi:hypothetical protein